MSEENNITTNDETPAPAPADMPEQAQEGATLGVADLQNAAQVIDIAVSRGAFRAGPLFQTRRVLRQGGGARGHRRSGQGSFSEGLLQGRTRRPDGQ